MAAGDFVVFLAGEDEGSSKAIVPGKYTIASITDATTIVLSASAVGATPGAALTASGYVISGNPVALAYLVPGAESGLVQWISPPNAGGDSLAYMVGGLEWSRMYKGLLRLFARAAYHGDPELSERLVRPVADILREMVHDMLTAAAERGEIRDSVDLEAATRLVHALTVAVGDSQLLPYLNTYFQVVEEGLPPERVLEAMISLVLHGISHDGATQAAE